LKDYCFCVVFFHYSTFPLINTVLCSSGTFWVQALSPVPGCCQRPSLERHFFCANSSSKLVHKLQACSTLLWLPPSSVSRCCENIWYPCLSTNSVAQREECWTRGPVLHPVPQPSPWGYAESVFSLSVPCSVSAEEKFCRPWAATSALAVAMSRAWPSPVTPAWSVSRGS